MLPSKNPLWYHFILSNSQTLQVREILPIAIPLLRNVCNWCFLVKFNPLFLSNNWLLVFQCTPNRPRWSWTRPPTRCMVDTSRIPIISVFRSHLVFSRTATSTRRDIGWDAATTNTVSSGTKWKKNHHRVTGTSTRPDWQVERATGTHFRWTGLWRTAKEQSQGPSGTNPGRTLRMIEIPFSTIHLWVKDDPTGSISTLKRYTLRLQHPTEHHGRPIGNHRRPTEHHRRHPGNHWRPHTESNQRRFHQSHAMLLRWNMKDLNKEDHEMSMTLKGSSIDTNSMLASRTWD